VSSRVLDAGTRMIAEKQRKWEGRDTGGLPREMELFMPLAKCFFLWVLSD